MTKNESEIIIINNSGTPISVGGMMIMPEREIKVSTEWLYKQPAGESLSTLITMGLVKLIAIPDVPEQQSEINEYIKKLELGRELDI